MKFDYQIMNLYIDSICSLLQKEILIIFKDLQIEV